MDLKQGQNEVVIKNLPSVLDGDSIRVDGIGKAVIFDVVYSEKLHPSSSLVSSMFIDRNASGRRLAEP